MYGRILLIPPMPGNCKVCGAKHGTDDPHNLYSLYYIMRFRREHGREPTWEDAIKDLSADRRKELAEKYVDAH